jgi:hypothetical protein
MKRVFATIFMTYDAKFDWWLAAVIAAAIALLVVGGNYWVGGPVLAVLLLCAYPQTYETTSTGLLVRAAFVRQLIPYRVITFIGPNASRVKIRYGLRSELLITPADQEKFLADLSTRTPHLCRQGEARALDYA